MGSRSRPLKRAQRCAREGCTRRKRDRYEFCCAVCYILADELRKTERLCRTAGDNKLSARVWSSAVAVSDAWTEYLQAAKQVMNDIEQRKAA